MKPLNSIFLFLVFLFPVIPSWASETPRTPLLEKVVNVKFENELLPSVLKKIGELGGFSFSYSSDVVDANRKVTEDFRNVTVREVLSQLFQETVTPKERKRYIILVRTQKASRDDQKVSGYVVDESTGQRLRNVSVYDPVSMSSVITNEYGYFQMKIPKPSTDEIKLKINRVNYADTSIFVTRDKRGLVKVKIKNTTNKLSVVADSVGKKMKRFWLATRKATIQAVNMENIDDTIHRDFQFSFVPFVGTNGKLSGNAINDFSINLIGGYSLGTQNFELGGLFNTVGGDVDGVQLGGWFNGVAGKTRGAQLAGFVNVNRGYTSGVQVAGLGNFYWSESSAIALGGLLNFMHKDSRGIKMAGLGNITLGDLKGPAVAGLFNFSSGDSYFAGIAGLINFSGGTMQGAQIGGLVNFTARDMVGPQVSGLINFAAKEIRGTQVGVLNYATKMKGAQVGLINLADSLRGVPVGFLSFVNKGGYHKIEISADEMFYTNFSFRTGVHKFYNIFSAGIRPGKYKNEKETLWTFGYGVGVAPKLSRRLYLNFDLTSNQVIKGGTIEKVNLLNKLFLGVEFQAARKISLVAGTTLNGQVTHADYSEYPDLFTEFKPDIIYDRTYSNNLNLKMWWGGKIGLRFL